MENNTTTKPMENNMKTEEEIERIAESKYKYSGNVYIAEIVQTKRVHFTKGYTQCQEDMVDKKYTEEDMLKFANQYSSINILHLKEHLKEFTLNKQD